MRRHITRPLLLLAALVALVALVAPAVQAQGTGQPRKLTAVLKGTGATFPNPLYQAWIQTYKQVNPGVTITYQGVGSGQGISDFIKYLTDFGGTDAAIAARPGANRSARRAPRAHGDGRCGANLQPQHRQAAALLRRNAFWHLPRRHHQVERPQDRGR